MTKDDLRELADTLRSYIDEAVKRETQGVKGWVQQAVTEEMHYALRDGLRTRILEAIEKRLTVSIDVSAAPNTSSSAPTPLPARQRTTDEDDGA